MRLPTGIAYVRLQIGSRPFYCESALLEARRAGLARRAADAIAKRGGLRVVIVTDAEIDESLRRGRLK